MFLFKDSGLSVGYIFLLTTDRIFVIKMSSSVFTLRELVL